MRAHFLKENKDMLAKLDTEVRKALGLIPAAAPVAAAQAAAQRAASGGKVATMPSRCTGSFESAGSEAIAIFTERRACSPPTPLPRNLTRFSAM